AIGREIIQRVVAPVVVVVGGRWIDIILIVLHLLKRQELYGADAQCAQIACSFPGSGIGAALGRWDARIVGGKAADVDLVTNVVAKRTFGLGAGINGRRNRVIENDAFRSDGARIFLAIGVARHVDQTVYVGGVARVVTYFARVGIEQQLVGVESIPARVDVTNKPCFGSLRP